VKILLKTNSLGLLQKAEKAEKKLAYASVNALNETAKKLQKQVQDKAKSDLNIRTPFSLRQTAVIKPFASVKQNRPYAEISIGRKERLLLTELETPASEKREPFTVGAKRVAVPMIDGMPRARFPQKLPKEMYFKALKLKRWPRGTAKGARPPNFNELRAGGQVIWRGRLRTYMIPSIGVFQRTSSTQSKPIYLFDDDVPIPKRLQFMDIMDRYGSEELTEQMERQIIKEIARGL